MLSYGDGLTAADSSLFEGRIRVCILASFSEFPLGSSLEPQARNLLRHQRRTSIWIVGLTRRTIRDQGTLYTSL